MANILLSYPRSANSWVRYFAEIVTGLPTSQATLEECNSNSTKSDSLINKNISKKAVLIKRHRFDFTWDKWDSEKDTLIVLVRDFREAIIRNNDEEASNCNYQKKSVESYLHVLESYHNWNGKKLLVYYEDLMINPKLELKRIGKFLQLDDKKTNSFIDDLSNHKARSIRLYKPGSATQGAAHKLHFHTLRKKKTASDITKLILEADCDIINYLSRYIY